MHSLNLPSSRFSCPECWDYGSGPPMSEFMCHFSLPERKHCFHRVGKLWLKKKKPPWQSLVGALVPRKDRNWLNLRLSWGAVGFPVVQCWGPGSSAEL